MDGFGVFSLFLSILNLCHLRVTLLKERVYMPKLKTHKGLAKRVKVTGTGKVKRPKCNGSHLMSGTSSKICRGLTKSAIVDSTRAKKIKTLLNK
jgi:large subunit ribosomal protein L35